MGSQSREFITPGIDKRQHRRVRLITEVKCEPMNRNEILVTRDVSVGGMFLNTKTPLPLNSPVTLAFTLASGMPPISCKGRVVYSMQGMGMGVEFADVNEDNRRSLEKFVDEAN